MKKKILTTVIAVAMAIGLVACGSSKTESLTTDGITIEGNYGEATKVTTKTKSLSDYKELASYLGDKLTGSVVYDITIKDKNGKAVQPDGKVNVTVDTEGIADKNSDYVVYYIDKSGAFEKMDVVASTAKKVTFVTSHFSVYAIGVYDSSKHSDDDFLKTSKEVADATATSEENAEATTENANASTEGGYTFTDKNGTIYVTQTVNVRDLPDTSGNKLTTVKAGTELILLGQCNETGWYKVEYENDKVGYVSNDYASTDKPQPAKQSVQSDNTVSQQSGGNGSGSTSASAGAPSAPSGKTLEECIAIAQSMGCDPYNGTWISDSEYVTYDVYSKSGYGMLPGSGPMDGRISLAEQVSSAVIYDDADMCIRKNTCRVTEWH